MRRLACALVWSACLAVPQAARAFDNDLELHKLGYPAVGGPVEFDAFAQERFARFASEFALATAPMPADLAASLGDAGFSIGLTPQMAFVHGKQIFSDGLERDVWPTETPSAQSKTLFLPTLHLRKGLPFSLELGTDISYIAFSGMVAMNASVKWAIVEGFQWIPDLSVRAFGGSVLGTGPFNIVTGGWDVGASYRFPLAGSSEAGLTVGYQRMGLNATTGNIDFRPGEEDADNPTNDDNVFQKLEFGPIFSPTTGFHRIYFGGQVRFRVLVLGIDGVWATGNNPIHTGATTSVEASVLKLAARLGIWF